MLVAGGTDLLPNMKRRQQVPPTLIGLRRIAELRSLVFRQAQDERDQAVPLAQSPSKGELTVGAGVTLAELVRDPRVREQYGALWQAASQVATPHLRNIGTLGGELRLR